MSAQFFDDVVTTLESTYLLAPEKCLVVGLYGPQGSGKTTLSAKICEKLILDGYKACAVSLDDFYLSKLQRKQLSEKIHPLLLTRGVPGTHDFQLGIDVFQSILTGAPTKLPVFDKAMDDVKPLEHWIDVDPNIQFLIFEGWCVGLPDILFEDLKVNPEPCNFLEKEQDKNNQWRNYVAKANRDYQKWYQCIDYMIGLRIPAFECVEDWRWQQECDMHSKKGSSFFESKEAVRNFIFYFERITKVAQSNINNFVDCVIEIDKDHQWQSMHYIDSNHAVNPRGVMTLHLTPLMQERLFQHRFILFTDLDGTMLGHDEYDLAQVPALLQKIHELGCSVIFNTSKTLAEVKALQQKLNYFAPCIVENGAGLYIPDELKHEKANLIDWSLLETNQFPGAVTRDTLLSFLAGISGFRFQQMSQWSCETVMLHTGLDRVSAVLANQRHYSEPLLWEDSDTQLVHFTQKVEKAGLRLVRGGRFCHLMGQHDKSGAMQVLQKAYELSKGFEVISIALGDNHNDKRMLELADIACVIPLPGREPLPISHPHMLVASSVAPKGWVESIGFILSLKE